MSMGGHHLEPRLLSVGEGLRQPYGHGCGHRQDRPPLGHPRVRRPQLSDWCSPTAPSKGGQPAKIVDANHQLPAEIEADTRLTPAHAAFTCCTQPRNAVPPDQTSPPKRRRQLGRIVRESLDYTSAEPGTHDRPCVLTQFTLLSVQRDEVTTAGLPQVHRRSQMSDRPRASVNELILDKP